MRRMTILLAPPKPVPQQKLQFQIDWWRIASYANCVAILLVAVFFRIWKLGNVPGVNGDEAWCGVVAVQILRGEPIAWSTPTGNPLNPFFFGPQLLLHALLPPSFTLLRIPAVASGIAVMGLNYWLCRKAFGRRVAVISSLMLAVLPINIAYSRFAWDACQSVLAVTIVMYTATVAAADRRHSKRSSIIALIALGAAVLVHPTNVFIAPLSVLLLGYRWREELSGTIQWLVTGRPKWLALLAVVTISVGLIWMMLPWVERVSAHVIHPSAVGEFVHLYGRLFSGTTVYEFISGVHSTDAPSTFLAGQWLDLAFWAQLLLLGYGVRRRIVERPRAVEKCVLLGYASSLIGFYLIAGPQALSPHFERYGMCLIAPGCLLGALGLTWWL